MLSSRSVQPDRLWYKWLEKSKQTFKLTAFRLMNFRYKCVENINQKCLKLTAWRLLDFDEAPSSSWLRPPSSDLFPSLSRSSSASSFMYSCERLNAGKYGSSCRMFHTWMVKCTNLGCYFHVERRNREMIGHHTNGGLPSPSSSHSWGYQTLLQVLQ